MENIKAIKIINKILGDLDDKGINKEILIKDIKELREYALEAKIPLVVKVLRYTYEHIEKYDSFLIPLIEDEALSEDIEVEENEAESPVESLKYLISLTKNLKNKGNIADLQEYKSLLMSY